MKLYVPGTPEARETQRPGKLAGAGGDGSVALLIKDPELGTAEPTTAVSFPRAPFSTVAEYHKL